MTTSEPEKQIEKLADVVKTMFTGVPTSKEVADVFMIFLDVLTNLQIKLFEDLANNKEENGAENEATLEEVKLSELRVRELIVKLAEKEGVDIELVRKQIKKEVNIIKGMIPKQADFGPIREEIKALEAKIPKIPAQMTPQEMRDCLMALEDGEKIPMEAIEGLIEALKKLRDEIAKGGGGGRVLFGGTNGILLSLNGVKKGLVKYLNLIPGSGVTFSYSYNNGSNDLTISATATGGGSNVETPTGTVDGGNTVFTVANTPLFIVVDGISKFLTTHYTYIAGTITITDGAPPTQYIRSIY